MTAIDTAAPVSRPVSLAAALLRVLFGCVPAALAPGDVRARRAFVQEMTARNPDAFASDLDVLAMMQHYPGQF